MGLSIESKDHLLHDLDRPSIEVESNIPESARIGAIGSRVALVAVSGTSQSSIEFGAPSRVHQTLTRLAKCLLGLFSSHVLPLWAAIP